MPVFLWASLACLPLQWGPLTHSKVQAEDEQLDGPHRGPPWED